MNLALPQDEGKKGVAAALCAFLTWGFLPLYWKLLSSVSASEVIGLRIAWSFIFMLLILLYSGGLGKSLLIIKNRKTLFILCCSGFLLAGNWLLYVWAVNQNQILATSLGYYINPLLNILAGRLYFKDKASPITWVAIGFAFLGVAYQVVAAGELPLISLGLGGSFAIYGLLRKIVVVEAIPGLFIETLATCPFALGYVFWVAGTSDTTWIHANTVIQILFVCLGVATSVPLLLFAYAARRISLTTIGLMQYISPSISFLLGVFVFHEPFQLTNLVTFGCIWFALALYTWENITAHKKKNQAST